MAGTSSARTRAASSLLVARALARSWLHRPVRLMMAATGGIAGVLLTTMLMMIAWPILQSTQTAPVNGVDPNVIAVAARAPAGMSPALATKVERGTDSKQSSRLLVASTTARAGSGGFHPVVMISADSAFPYVLDQATRHELDVANLPQLGANDAYIERDWARARGLRVRDHFDVTTPKGPLALRVAGLSPIGFANGASVFVRASTAAAAFDRGKAVDVLLLLPRGSRAEARKRATALVDGAADVVSPSEVFSSYGRIYRTPLMLVAMFGMIALLVGGVVLFLTWRLVLSDSRPTLSRLRLIGVRSGDLLLGSWLALLPVLLASYVIGATAGCLIGGLLSSARSQITNFTEQAFDLSPSVLPALAGGLLAALVMFGFAWLTGVWQLRRATAFDAIAGRETVAVAQSRALWPTLAGVGCLALAAAAVILVSGPARALAGVPLVVGVVLLSAALPVLAGIAIRSSGSGPSGLLVGRQLEVGWRRNAAFGVTFALALLGSTTMFGAASSLRKDIDASSNRWTTGGDFYMTAAKLGQSYESERFTPAVREQVSAIPGVHSTNAFAYVNAVVKGGRRLVETVFGDAKGLTSPRLTEGPPDALAGRRTLWDLLRGNDIVISSNFARTQHLGVGDSVDIPVTDGHRTGRVVAVVDDSISDGGMVMVSHELFHEVGGNSRLFYVGARLEPGADPAAVRRGLEAIAQHHPRAEVLSVKQYRADVSSLLGRLMSSFTAFALVMYGVAGLVGTATLASSISERRRAVALTRLVGGRRRAVETLLGLEAMVTVTIAWAVAGIGGLVGIPAMIGGQSLFSGLLPDMREPVGIIGLSLLMTGVATALALLVARRSVGERPLAELVADE